MSQSINYFAYIRVSTIKQGEHGVSLQEQRSAIEQYAERNNLTIEEWFEEQETAAKRGRPVFGRMLKCLRTKRVRGVIIHKIDRSARNLKDWADLGELIDQGVEVHFANESLDLSSRGGRLSADIQAVVAADYIRNLREETKKGFYGRLKQGLFPLPAPIGYLDKGKGLAKAIDPIKAPLVRRLFELYGTGQYSLYDLVKEAQHIGLTNRKNLRISHSGISTILNNPFYYGVIRVRGSGDYYPGAHDPIISPSLFERVQRILRGKTNTKFIIHDFLFRRMLKCKLCRNTLVGELQKGHVYYRCHTKTCPTRSIREEYVAKKLLERLVSLQIHPDEIEYIKVRANNLRKSAQDNLVVSIQALRIKLENIKARCDRLTDALLDDLIDREMFEHRRQSLLWEQKDTEEKISSISENPALFVDVFLQNLERANSALLTFQFGSIEDRRELIKTITSNRVVDRKKIEIELKTAFASMANRPFEAYSAPSCSIPRTLGGTDTWDKLMIDFQKAYEEEKKRREAS